MKCEKYLYTSNAHLENIMLKFKIAPCSLNYGQIHTFTSANEPKNMK